MSANESLTLPTGRVDTIDTAGKKLTIQTEFFFRPQRHVETKVYLGGALKKIYSEDASQCADDELQHFVNRFHDAKFREIVDALQNLKKG